MKSQQAQICAEGCEGENFTHIHFFLDLLLHFLLFLHFLHILNFFLNFFSHFLNYFYTSSVKVEQCSDIVQKLPKYCVIIVLANTTNKLYFLNI